MTNPPQLKPLPAAKTSSLAVSLPPVAPVQEVFSSFQGEGPWVGRRQLFVRFAHCHLKCTYCDTTMHSPDGRAHISLPDGQLISLDNPLTADALTAQLLACLAQTPHHSVSFTGGEPLLYHHLLQAVLPRIRPVAKTYLETSGTQPDRLTPLLPHIDMVAMDVKLPSATGERPYWQEHAEFLRLSLQTGVFIKLVFNDTVTDDELVEVAKLAQISRQVPVILQPETSLNTLSGQTPPLNASQSTMFKVAESLQKVFNDVRLIPQTHKMVAVR